jgi:serine/threonine protein kinase
MPTATCPSREQLLAFQLGDLPEPTLQDVAEHLETCSSCETLAQQLDSEMDQVLSAIRRQPGDTARPSGTVTNAVGPAAPASGDFAFLLPPVLPDEIGRLGNYRVLRLLGKGGMAFVFQAEDIALRRPVALKVMKPDLNSDADGWQRFLREARIMAAIKHEHLVTVYQAGQEGTVVYLAMELLEGESLGKRLERTGTADVPEILRLARDICSGLAVVHGQGLIHRDIKPDNIWLEAPNARVKILDFGLARFVNDDVRLTQAGTIMGTPSFMAPEQARGQAVDARSDLFSLGCILYALCTGNRPFHASNTMAVLTALAVDNPRPINEINPSIPPALAQLVMQLLAKDPANRPASAEAVLERLEQIQAFPDKLMPEPASQPATRRSIPRTAAVALAAAGVACLVLLAVFLKGRVGSKTAPEAASVRSSEAGTPAPVQRHEVTWPAAGEQGDYLKDLKPVQQDWWFMPPLTPFLREENTPYPKKIEDYPVRVQGKRFTHSFFMHPPPPGGKGKDGPPPQEFEKAQPEPSDKAASVCSTSITFRLGKRYKVLHALVSMNDGPRESEAPMTFSVHGDGKLLWKSKPVLTQNDSQRLDISVAGIDVFKIEVTHPLAPGRGAHGVWIEPFLAK